MLTVPLIYDLMLWAISFTFLSNTPVEGVEQLLSAYLSCLEIHNIICVVDIKNLYRPTFIHTENLQDLVRNSEFI